MSSTSIQTRSTSRTADRSTAVIRIYYLIAIIVFSMLSIVLSACSTGNAPVTTAAPTQPVLITQSLLEEQYGLRVSLVAVTAAGGLVDLRLKFVDAEKARSLLQDPKNFPALWIADGDVTLNAPEDVKAKEIQFEKDGNVFLMYPNAGDVVKPGTAVTVVFGDIQVEPIAAK